MRSNWSDSDAALASSERLETALRQAFEQVAVPAGAAERMLAALPSGSPPVALWRRRGPRIALAAAAAAALIVGLNPTARESLATTVRHAFSYIPGIGIRPTSGETLVLAEPASVTREGVTFRIIAVYATDESTTLTYEVVGLPGSKEGYGPAHGASPYLLDERGKRYYAQFVSGGIGGSSSENHAGAIAGFLRLPKGTRSLTLVADPAGIPSELAARIGTWRVAFTLVPASEAPLAQAGPGGASLTLQGITVRVDQVAQMPDRVVAHLSAYGPRNMRVDRLEVESLLPPFVHPAFGAPGTFDVTLPAGTATLRVDRVVMRAPGSASLQISLPSTPGEFAIDRQVMIGRYPLTLDRGELVDRQGQSWLRLYVRPGRGDDGGRLLTWRTGNSMSAHFSQDRAFEWFEVPAGSSRQLTLRLAEPEVAFDGPWELTLATPSSRSD